MVTTDVVGLYPQYSTDGLEALLAKLKEREDKSIASEDLLQMARFVLKNNFFEFDSKIKQQISGRAIGRNFAPPNACIFMDKFETDFLTTQNLKPWVWPRYIDDILFVWTHGEEKLHDFLSCLNEFHPNLKFTYEYSTEHKGRDKFETYLYCKATDCHQYIHYESCHPDHMKKLSIYSQGLPIKRLCSEDHKLQKHLENLKNWFCERGYPGGLIDEQLQRVRRKSREQLLRPKGMDNKSVGVPFVVTYHQYLKNISKIIKKHIKHLYILILRLDLFSHLYHLSLFVMYEI